MLVGKLKNKQQKRIKFIDKRDESFAWEFILETTKRVIDFRQKVINKKRVFLLIKTDFCKGEEEQILTSKQKEKNENRTSL